MYMENLLISMLRRLLEHSIIFIKIYLNFIYLALGKFIVYAFYLQDSWSTYENVYGLIAVLFRMVLFQLKNEDSDLKVLYMR